MVTSYLHNNSQKKQTAYINLYRIDPITGRIDSKPFRTTVSSLSKPGNEYLSDPYRYSKIPGSPTTEKQRFDLLRINPTLTIEEIFQKLFGAKPPPPPVVIEQPPPPPIIQASVIPSTTTPAPVAEPTIKQTVSQLIPQLDAPSIIGEAKKLPLLPIAAGVGALILIFAVVRKKRK